MKPLKLLMYCFAALILTSSCKKEKKEVLPEPQSSQSFTYHFQGQPEENKITNVKYYRDNGDNRTLILAFQTRETDPSVHIKLSSFTPIETIPQGTFTQMAEKIVFTTGNMRGGIGQLFEMSENAERKLSIQKIGEKYSINFGFTLKENGGVGGLITGSFYGPVAGP